MALTLHAPWYRVRLSYRADQAITATVAVGGAFAAVLSGAAPTDNPTVDAVLIAVAVALVSFAAGTAPRRTLAVLSSAVAIVALAPILTVIGLAAGLFAYASTVRHRDEAAPGTITAAIALNVAFRWELGGFFGLASLLGVALAAAIVILGLRNVERETRRNCAIGAVASVAAVCVVAVGAGASARSATDDVAAGIALSDEAAERLESGDHTGAALLLESSAARFDRANARLNGVTATAARLMPIAAQHMRAGDELTTVAAHTLRGAATAVVAADQEALAVRGGRIDLEALQALQAPTNELVASINAARHALDKVDSPWLLTSLSDRLASTADELDERSDDLDVVADSVAVAPDLLGGDGPRRYLVLFATPSEARGLGGFVGNYAEIVVEDGRFRVASFGRRANLEDQITRTGATCEPCPDALLREFGRFGFATGADGGVAPRVWSNLTMSPHFPDVAQAAATLYPQSGGREIDGVMAMDPYVMEALMGYTGAVELPELGVTVEPANAADFMLRDQYLLTGDDTQEQRIDALDHIAGNVMASLLGGALPGPVDLVRDLGPLAAERRLVAWSAHEDEQALFVAAGFAGDLPAPAAGGRFAFTVDNASANKIETFLKRTVTFETVERPDGSITTVATVMLRNGAPSSGLPKYVIGNEVGLPDGSSRTMLTFYVPDDAAQATVERDGDSIVTERGSLSGWSSHRHFVELAAGESTIYRVDLGIDVGSNPDELVAWEQPLSR